VLKTSLLLVRSPPHSTPGFKARRGSRSNALRRRHYDGAVRALRHAFVAAAVAASAACADSSGGSGGNPAAPGPWMPGAFQPASTFAAQCAAPRAGIDPVTGAAYPDKPGSTLAENNWLRSWTHDLYLWYREVPDLDPGAYATTADYFGVLKTSAT